jgi:site-specific recombinase XerD
MKALRGYSVFQRAGRGVWYVTYLSTETGRWKQEATLFRTDDPMGHKKACRLGEQLAHRYFRTAQGSHHEAFAGWVCPYLLRRYRDGTKTHTRYICAWDNLRDFMTERQILRPSQWDYRHNGEYLDWRTTQVRNNGKRYTRNTAIFELKLLGTLMQEAVRRGMILTNPCERLGLPRDPAKEKRELTDADITKLRQFVATKEAGKPITEQWQTVCLEIAIHQGCRLTETSVPMSDVDEIRGTITFRGKGRNGVARVFTTQMHPELRTLMSRLRAAEATRTCILPKMAGKVWFFDFREAGVMEASFHCTRVTVITRMARAGVPEQQARRFVNHSSKAVHAVYQKLRAEDLTLCTQALSFAPTAGKPGGR